ncbi:molybdopterin molybdotransferase MoeA [Acetobacter indonesiensis]
MRNMFTGMVDYATALQLILACVAPEREHHDVLPLSQLSGRIAAQDILAKEPRPVADISAMDGYAFSHAAMASASAGLPVVGQSIAGDMPAPIPSGAALAILTGSRIPSGADCVMAGERMQYDEHTGLVKPLQTLAAQGANIRKAGEEFTQGTVLVQRGQVLDWRHIALMASQGMTHGRVMKPINVAIIANGAELAPDAADSRTDSNTPMLAAMVASVGAESQTYQVYSDDAEELETVLSKAWNVADVIVTTGGISVGNTDNVLDALKNIGTETVFRGVKIRPGKPLSVMQRAGKLAFCLPGNPGASAICALAFLLPYLCAAMGKSNSMTLQPGVVDFDFNPVCDTTHFVPVRCLPSQNGWQISHVSSVGASDIRVFTQATALLRVDAEKPVVSGQVCWVLPLQSR